MQKFLSFITINHLSIDVVIGSIISSIFLSIITDIKYSNTSLLILGLVVWSIYTFDHLLDAKNSKADQLSARLAFHKRHSSILTKALIFTILLTACLLPFIPYKTLLYGTVLSSAVLVYFLSIHFLKSKFILHKELVIAIIYTAGICLGPVSQMTNPISNFQLLVISIFFIIVLFNLLVFSLMDQKEDLNAKFPSFVMAAGEPITLVVLKVLGLVGIALITYLTVLGFVRESVLLASMFGVLQIIFWRRENTYIIKYYRYAGDGIFLFPIFYLL
ncbi:hypothetical protein [Fulvivirga lutimaris]|uniref:hypothetical protein n=1 Tax=Fulvivirga lutimaris TaxID=1819566 RepID=UPI0012BC3134|nr:hypothetical protein [Fulvivirga lutimaris]